MPPLPGVIAILLPYVGAGLAQKLVLDGSLTVAPSVTTIASVGTPVFVTGVDCRSHRGVGVSCTDS
jgi:outer membrane protein W